ncbi:hypothetical protein PG999_009919 [Apiospora kogelbergensis]|uniref:Uncharacterized protein n=1 Tax=Apiospora kogelbergensis TaxID=1337665 RepID=A0AAW0QVH8_9PEZI
MAEKANNLAQKLYRDAFVRDPGNFEISYATGFGDECVTILGMDGERNDSILDSSPPVPLLCANAGPLLRDQFPAKEQTNDRPIDGTDGKNLFLKVENAIKSKTANLRVCPIIAICEVFVANWPEVVKYVPEGGCLCKTFFYLPAYKTAPGSRPPIERPPSRKKW